MATEGVTLEFTPEAISALAGVAEEVNSNIENIGGPPLDDRAREKSSTRSALTPTDSTEGNLGDRRSLRAKTCRRFGQGYGSVEIYFVGIDGNRCDIENLRTSGEAL